MTAVAVWDHEPSADELLSRRVEGGWTPTPTAMQEGMEVLGHASCLVGKEEGVLANRVESNDRLEKKLR